LEFFDQSNRSARFLDENGVRLPLLVEIENRELQVGYRPEIVERVRRRWSEYGFV